MFIGNQHLVGDFKKLAHDGNLAHGYIFFGEPQVGKFSFALCLANFLETKFFGFPDKMLSEALIIKESGIDCVREIRGFLWQKPHNSLKRVVIIDNADSLTDEAQNAILKIAEEPPEHALIILIANNTDNLLPPIVSRLHKIYFSRSSKKEIAEFLVKEKGVEKKASEKIVEESYGRPGRALELIDNNTLSEIKEVVDKFLKSSGYSRSQLIKSFVEEQKENPIILDQFFEFLLVELRKKPIQNHETIKSVLSRLFLIKSYNVNKRLQIEAIL